MDKHVNMQNGHAAWTCNMDMQQGHAAGTCSIDIQPGCMEREHRHEAWTQAASLWSIGMQNGRVKMEMHVGQATLTRRMDIQRICRMVMQHGHEA